MKSDGHSGKPETASKKLAAGENTLKAKSSWFGLFSRAKDSASENGDTAAGEESKKVIRANLGEESSFYFDKDLKKWVNKKDPASMQASAKAAPPPPKAKGPIGRVVSENTGIESSAGVESPPSFIPPPPLSASSAAVSAAPPRSNSMPPPPLSSKFDASSRPPSAGGKSNAGETGTGNPSPSSTTSLANGTMPPPPSLAATAGVSPTSSSTPPTVASTPAPSSSASQSRPSKLPASSSSSDIDLLLAGPSGSTSGSGTIKGRRGRGGAGRYVDVMAKP